MGTLLFGQIIGAGFFESKELKENVERFVLLGAVDDPMLFFRELQSKNIGEVRSRQSLESYNRTDHPPYNGCIGITIPSLPDHILNPTVIIQLIISSSC